MEFNLGLGAKPRRLKMPQEVEAKAAKSLFPFQFDWKLGSIL